MLKNDKPFFMTNSNWYYYDDKKFKYKLTDKAPQEAVNSYNKYYDEMLKEYENNKDAE